MRLTDRGAQLIDRLFRERVQRETGFLGPLDDQERAHLADLLMRILTSMEGSSGR